MRVMVLIAIVFAACVSARTADAEQIQNRGKCLTVRGNRAANGTPIILWHCTGGINPGQQWHFRGGQLVSLGMCLTVRGGRVDDGTNIILWPCGSPQDSAQQWRRIEGEMRSITNRCLNVQGGTEDDGTPIILYHCQGGTPNELWEMVRDY
jgi:Ricin-type beta-trefoil lectin domain